VVTVYSRVLTGFLTSGEGRVALCSVRKNIDHLRETVCPRDFACKGWQKESTCQGVGRILRAILSALLSSHVSSNFLGPASILDLLKCVVKSYFLIAFCSCHIRPDSALEKAGKPKVSWPILYNVTSATGSLSHAADRRREMGQYIYVFVPASSSPAGDSWKFSWLVHYPGGEKELIFTRLCTGELLS